MRNLKFRVWDKRYKQYVKPYAICLDGRAISITEPNNDLETLDSERVIIEFNTGLKDKNGKEIYEADVLKFRGRVYEVKFDDYGQFCLENKKYHWLSDSYSFRSVDIWCAEGILVEVVGNVHESNMEELCQKE